MSFCRPKRVRRATFEEKQLLIRQHTLPIHGLISARPTDSHEELIVFHLVLPVLTWYYQLGTTKLRKFLQKRLLSWVEQSLLSY